MINFGGPNMMLIDKDGELNLGRSSVLNTP